ncbi:MAG: ATP-binding protein [Verrucomicrobiota bacterium]|jgi:PAS domain S-box-containing protein
METNDSNRWSGRVLNENESNLLGLREQWLNAFFANTTAGLVLLDADLRYVKINDTAAKINGVPMKDHLGKAIREVLPKFAPVVEPLLQKVLATGEPILNTELSGEKPGRPGLLQHLMESFFPTFGEDGRPDGVGVIFVDITERKQAEDQLRRRTAFMKALVECALDGILVVDSQGKKIIQNQRLNELWKIPPHIAENKDDAEQVQFVAKKMKDPGEFIKKVACLYAHPDMVTRDEIELVDGTVLDRYSSPVEDKAGKYYGRIWTFRDITERRKLEEQFRQAQKMEAIGHLAAGVAHDFNNILAVIQLSAGLLQKGSNLSAEQLDFADQIQRAARRAADLTRHLLLFSRKQALELRDLDVNDVVTNITKMLRRILGEDIQMQFKYAPEPLLIHADGSMIDQVLLNLTVNARDAMPNGGQLIIETSAVEFDEITVAQSPEAQPGPFVCLSISDTGCGIPPEILPKIFEPFFTTKDVGKGTGLGLASVYGIVQQHQGWIKVYSEVGKGTTLRIYLPRLARPSDPEAIWSSLASVCGGNETLLLVEDESSVRTTIRIALSRLGYRTLEASSAVEALEVWNQHRGEIQFVLTDMLMPGGMNGKELVQRLRQENPGLKVIYTSGYCADIIGKDLLLQEGVNFLAKPFEAHKLAYTVRNCLDQ